MKTIQDKFSWKSSRLPDLCMSSFEDIDDPEYMFYQCRDSRVGFENFKYNTLQPRDHSFSCQESVLRENYHTPFEHYVFHLRKVIDNSETMDQVKENLLQINRWCFLNVGPSDYGFYTPGQPIGNNALYLYNGNRQALFVHACVAFKNSNDALAFRLKF